MALSGIKILDFSRILAAPFTSMILSDLGAEVWKIEQPGTGDDVRSWIPPSINEQSCYFLCVNRNKKSIALNLKHPEGQKIVNYFFLIHVLRPEIYLEKLTYYWKIFEQDKWKVLGYGSTGPFANDPGFDVIVAAIGGLLGITGPAPMEKNGICEPAKPGVAVVDLMTGLYAHGAILAALYARQNGNTGQHIQCNLLATQICTLINIGSNYLNTGQSSGPLGTEHASIVPYQAFKTRDNRFYVVGAANQSQFIELCHLMDLPELPTNPLYNSNENRVKNRKELLKIISNNQDLSYWTKVLRSNKLPSGAVNSLEEAFAHEQVKHLGLVQKVKHRKYEEVTLTGPAVKYSKSTNQIYSAPPTLGEHTQEILKNELNLSDNELADLKSKKIIDY